MTQDLECSGQFWSPRYETPLTSKSYWSTETRWLSPEWCQSTGTWLYFFIDRLWWCKELAILPVQRMRRCCRNYSAVGIKSSRDKLVLNYTLEVTSFTNLLGIWASLSCQPFHLALTSLLGLFSTSCCLVLYCIRLFWLEALVCSTRICKVGHR